MVLISQYKNISHNIQIRLVPLVEPSGSVGSSGEKRTKRSSEEGEKEEEITLDGLVLGLGLGYSSVTKNGYNFFDYYFWIHFHLN